LSPWKKGLERLSGLDGKTKMAIGGLLLLFVMVLGCGARAAQSNRFVDLYPVKMSEESVREVSMALTDHRVVHTVAPAQDGILLHPSEVRDAQAYLAGRSLPRFHPQDTGKKPFSPTSLQQLQHQRQQLESELVYTLRQVDGVIDARVRLAFPDKTYFRDDSKIVTASVYLQLSKNLESVAGIASLVAHSVPELQPENVTIVDQNGKEIGRTEEPLGLEYRVQTQMEERLQEKLQLALGKMYGQGVHAVVDLTLDFSQEEVRRYTPGSVSDDGMVKDSIQLVHEMLEGSTQETSKKYDQKKEAINYKYTENYFAKLRQRAKVERITASVLVNNASDEEKAMIENIVKGAIGIDESRNDQVYVSTAPWNQQVMQTWSQPVAPMAVADSEKEPSSPLDYAGLAIGCCLVLAASGLVLTRRTKPVLGGGRIPRQNAACQGIVDHKQSKDGSGTLDTAQTAPQQDRVQSLEALMDSQPQKVASLLRSTWLS